MRDLRISRVEASALVPGVAGKRIGPGQLVDLNEPVGPRHRVRDLFPERWFEPAPISMPAQPGAAWPQGSVTAVVDPATIASKPVSVARVASKPAQDKE